MVVVAASGVEGGAAEWALRRAFEIVGNGQLCAAGAAQNRCMVPFAAGPNFHGMTGERDVAVSAGIVNAAAFHFDGDNVRRRVVMQATRLGIEIQSADLWSFCGHLDMRSLTQLGIGSQKRV